MKAKELHMYQLELKEQYRVMQQLKKRKESSQANQGSEELNVQHLDFSNRIKITEGEITTSKVSVSDLKRESGRLEKTLSLYDEEEKRNQPKVNEYSSENTGLKKKILSLRKLGTEREHESGKIMNSMYSIKTKVTKNEEMEKEF